MSKRSRNEAEEAKKHPTPMHPAYARYFAELEARRKEHLQKKAERERNMKMPSHPAPLTREQRLRKCLH